MGRGGGAHLMETLKSPIAPGTINFMLTIGKALGVGLGPIASWVFGELRAAKDVQARNGKIDVHKEALLHLSSLTTEANLQVVDMFVARAAEDFKALGEIGGRIDASVVGPRSKAAESEADATEGAAGRFEQARRGGHEISEDRLGDFDAHAALEVAQADAKVTELLEDVRCYREALAQVERAGADATAKGWGLIAEAKDAYLSEITGEAEGPAVTVTLALAHNPVAFGTLNEAGGRVAPADCWFTVSARHTIDAKVPESSVMRKHVQTKSVDALLAQDRSVMLRFEPGALEVLVKPDGGMERRGESGYHARFGAGMLEGDPGMSRKDLSRRDEARGGRVVDAVLALVRSTPIGALQRAAVRSI